MPRALRIKPAEHLAPAHKGMKVIILLHQPTENLILSRQPATPVLPEDDGVAGVAVKPPRLPGITRRVIEGTNAVDDLLNVVKRGCLLVQMQVGAHDLKLNPETQGFQLLLHQSLIQVGPATTRKELPPQEESHRSPRQAPRR